MCSLALHKHRQKRGVRYVKIETEYRNLREGTPDSLYTNFRAKEDTEIIPSDYNPDVPPMVGNLPTSVYVSLQILGIDKINEATMDFRLILLIAAAWKDPRLNLKNFVSEYPVMFPNKLMKNLWKPNFGYPNTKMIEKFYDSSRITSVKVLPDESLLGGLRMNFLVDCPMKLHDYPIDIQICQFLLGISEHSDKGVMPKWMGEENSPYKYLGKSIQIRSMNLLSYEMDEIKAKKETQKWVSGNFTILIAEFKFKRRLTGNLINVYIPSTLIVMLSWLSFWIDVHATPARVTLGVTSILTLVTHLVESKSFAPPVDYLKALDIWFIFCIVLIFLSLLEYAPAYQSAIKMKEKKEIQVHSKDSHPKKKKSGMIRRLFSLIKDIKNTLIDSEHINPYDRVSRYIFPFVFMNFASIYWTYYLSHRQAD
ncbi:glycine receptor subunit alpha-4-like [Centruroides vittatus]|uniref:glycine receptor subunit alpha-4-like n=1 Tax=Centruroides vittatus TaxID=120091 RepID=UPI00350ECE74